MLLQGTGETGHHCHKGHSWSISKLMRCCCRALEDLDIAAEHDPSSVYTTFVKIKVLLTQGEASKALDELQPLMACEDFSLDFLRVNDHPHKSYGLTARVNETLDRQNTRYCQSGGLTLQTRAKASAKLRVV